MILTRRAFDPHAIKLVIFDLDGTLIDSRLDLVHSVNAALRHIGRPELPDDVIASYVGDGAPILIQRALGGETVEEAVVRQGLQFFLSYYREHKLDHTTVYPGVKEALTRRPTYVEWEPSHDGCAFQQARRAVAGHRRSAGIGPVLQADLRRKQFCQQEAGSRGRAQIARENGVRPEEDVIVGDSHVDVETGVNAGLWTSA